MVALHAGVMISTIPFPFPYAQACDCLLIIQWVLTPLIIQSWTTHWTWAFIFSFIMVFTYWSLNSIAINLENPFGVDDNDMDFPEMQAEMNRHLVALLGPSVKHIPSLSLMADRDVGQKYLRQERASIRFRPDDSKDFRCFATVWQDVDLREDFTGGDRAGGLSESIFGGMCVMKTPTCTRMVHEVPGVTDKPGTAVPTIGEARSSWRRKSAGSQDTSV